MYIDDENPLTLDPVYLSKSYGTYTGEYLWAVYGYAYDVHDWELVIKYMDIDIGCTEGTLISNSMGARSSSLYGFYDAWANVYNQMRISTSKSADSFLENDDWKKTEEGIMLWGAYYDEELKAYDYVGGYESVTYQKGEYVNGAYTYSVDKNSGVCLYEGFQYPYGNHSNSFWEVKTIVSPEQYALMTVKEKAVAYDYSNIENDIKSFCSNRNGFGNFTLDLPEKITHVRVLFSGIDVSGNNTSYLYNPSRVFKVGSPLTLNGATEEGYAVDYYEIWDFALQKWVRLSDSSTCTINTESNPFTDAVYLRAIIHKQEVTVELCEVTINGGYVWYDDKELKGTFQIPIGTKIYPNYNEVPGKEFDHWEDSLGVTYKSGSSITITGDNTLTAVYVDKTYYLSVKAYDEIGKVTIKDQNGEGDGPVYWGSMTGKIGTVFTLTAICDEDEANANFNQFLGWFRGAPGVHGGQKFYLISEETTINYTISLADEDTYQICAVWTDGTVSLEKYADIRMANGFVYVKTGEEALEKDYKAFDNAFTCVRMDTQVFVLFYDDPTDEVVYTKWKITYENSYGNKCEDYAEDFEDLEYDYFERAQIYLESPEYVEYKDNEILVSGYEEIVIEEKV